MPLVKTMRSRGSTIVVEAHAEVLFARTGPVGNFARRFTDRAKTYTAAAAPGNKRPTWGHEPAAHGRSLKNSFRASTRYVPALMRVFSAVGSTANYAAFVDQGTGVYNGGSPWQAKILPPSTQFGADLYEKTWIPSGRADGKPVAERWIQGQKAQHFFAHGLDRTFRSMTSGSAKVPGARLAGAITSFPDDLANFAGAGIDTGRGSAFRASLEQWRAQRDAAWATHRLLGPGGHNARELARRDSLSAARRANRAMRESRRPRVTKPDRPTASPTRPTMTNEEKYLASKAAAARRRARDDERVRRQRAARELAQQRMAEEKAKRERDKQARIAANSFEKARKDAYAYAARLRPAYPNIEVLVSQKNGVVRVRWTDSTGETHRQDFS